MGSIGSSKEFEDFDENTDKPMPSQYKEENVDKKVEEEFRQIFDEAVSKLPENLVKFSLINNK